MLSHDFKSAQPGWIQESEFSEVLLCTHIYWLLFKFLSQFLVSLFLKGKKNTGMSYFFFFPTKQLLQQNCMQLEWFESFSIIQTIWVNYIMPSQL